MANKKTETKKTETKKTEPKKTELFENYGECDSATEINQVADGFYNEGDLDSLKKFAKENGFDESFVSVYLEEKERDPQAELCDPITAAIAKLDLEKEENKDLGIFADDIIQYLMSECDDIELAKGIRKKGKRLRDASQKIYDEARKNKIKINGTEVGYCGPMKGFSLIRGYYGGAK